LYVYERIQLVGIIMLFQNSNRGEAPNFNLLIAKGEML
jgi:hypothetical protein